MPSPEKCRCFTRPVSVNILLGLAPLIAWFGGGVLVGTAPGREWIGSDALGECCPVRMGNGEDGVVVFDGVDV